MPPLTLSILPSALSVCQLPAGAAIPTWVSGDFFAITGTPQELSIVCPSAQIPAGVRVENGWRGFKVEGPLDFALIGILANLAGTLAQAGISIFAISTYDTDYLLVREKDLPAAAAALRAAGHQVLDQ